MQAPLDCPNSPPNSSPSNQRQSARPSPQQQSPTQQQTSRKSTGNFLTPSFDDSAARRKSALASNGFLADYSCSRRRSSTAQRDKQYLGATSGKLNYASPVRALRGNSFAVAGNHAASAANRRATSVFSPISSQTQVSSVSTQHLSPSHVPSAALALAGSRKTSIFDPAGHSLVSSYAVPSRRKSAMVTHRPSACAAGSGARPGELQFECQLAVGGGSQTVEPPTLAAVAMSAAAAAKRGTAINSPDLVAHVPVIGCSPTSISASLAALEETQKYQKLIKKLKKHQEKKERRRKRDAQRHANFQNFHTFSNCDDFEVNDELDLQPVCQDYTGERLVDEDQIDGQTDDDDNDDDHDDASSRNCELNDTFGRENHAPVSARLRRKSLRLVKGAMHKLANVNRRDSHSTMTSDGLSVSSMSLSSASQEEVPLYLSARPALEFADAGTESGPRRESKLPPQSLRVNSIFGAQNSAAVTSRRQAPVAQQQTTAAGSKLGSSKGEPQFDLHDYWFYYNYLRENSFDVIDDLPLSGVKTINESERKRRMQINYSLARLEILNANPTTASKAKLEMMQAKVRRMSVVSTDSSVALDYSQATDVSMTLSTSSSDASSLCSANGKHCQDDDDSDNFDNCHDEDHSNCTARNNKLAADSSCSFDSAASCDSDDANNCTALSGQQQMRVPQISCNSPSPSSHERVPHAASQQSASQLSSGNFLSADCQVKRHSSYTLQVSNSLSVGQQNQRSASFSVTTAAADTSASAAKRAMSAKAQHLRELQDAIQLASSLAKQDSCELDDFERFKRQYRGYETLRLLQERKKSGLPVDEACNATTRAGQPAAKSREQPKQRKLPKKRHATNAANSSSLRDTQLRSARSAQCLSFVACSDAASSSFNSPDRQQSAHQGLQYSLSARVLSPQSDYAATSGGRPDNETSFERIAVSPPPWQEQDACVARRLSRVHSTIDVRPQQGELDASNFRRFAQTSRSLRVHKTCEHSSTEYLRSLQHRRQQQPQFQRQHSKGKPTNFDVPMFAVL